MLACLATLTATACWFAYKRNSFSIAFCALVLDVIYFVGPVGGQWTLYIFGANRLGIRIYAVYPATTFLPSFGDHLAPNAMHCVMSSLSALALAYGVLATACLRKTARFATRATATANED
jgi:hypothetical protein